MPTPTNTCSNCDHWKRMAAGGGRADTCPIGECRGGPPVADFKFPRTRATDSCGSHSSVIAVNFATAARVASDEPKTAYAIAAEKAGLRPGEMVAEGDPRLGIFQTELAAQMTVKASPAPVAPQSAPGESASLFDADPALGGKTEEADRAGGPVAAVAAIAPQSTAATDPGTSPDQQRTPAAASTAPGASRSGPRRNQSNRTRQ